MLLPTCLKYDLKKKELTALPAMKRENQQKLLSLQLVTVATQGTIPLSKDSRHVSHAGSSSTAFEEVH